MIVIRINPKYYKQYGQLNGEFLEYSPVAVDPLRAEMFSPRMVPDSDGYVTVPDRPGIGFELNMEFLSRYRKE